MIRRLTRLRTFLFGLIALLGAASASAQLPGFASFQAITITNNTSSLVLGYQVPVIFNTQALISAGQLQATGADIRFHATCGGGIIFPHYLDTGLNTTATRLWVKVDSLPASSSRTIYLSYNNPTAANTSTISIFPGPFSSTNQVTGGTAGGVGLSQRGFRFSPNTDILVAQFGKDEPTGTTRTVTIFNFATQAIVRQGTVSGAAGVYSYNNLASPVWLTAGTQYLLELFQGTGDGYYFGTSSQINANLTYLDMRYCNSCTSTTFPASVLTNYHYGYPDFNFYTRTIITPAPTVALGGGGGAIPTVTIAANPSGAICNGGPVTFTPTPVNGGTAPTYQWFKNGTAAATGATYTITTPVNGDQVYAILTGNSACASTATATSNTITLAVGTTPAQPGTITGNLTPCSGTSENYSITAVTGATTYTWAVPAGWTITTGQGTTTITAAVTLNNGTLSVTAGNTTCGNSAARTATVTVGSTPSTPGPITGNTIVCGTASQTYSVAAVTSATGYNWTLPAGWVITAGANTNTITVTPSTSTTSGNISVSASNICGTSASSVLAITAGTVPVAPGPVSGNATVCAGSANVYSVPPSTGLTYNFTVPTGWTFTQTGSSISTVAGSTGNIIITATNGTCGTSAPTTFPVVVNPILTPAVSISNTSTGNTICSGTNLSFNANSSGGGSNPSYQWKLNGGNVGLNAPTYSNNLLQNGDVVTVVMTSNYPCLTATSATAAPVTITVIPSVTPGISINTTPPTTLCASAALTFTTITNAAGSAPSYQWFKNGTPLGVTTPTYTTATLANGDSISVQLTTSATCATMPSAMSNKVGLTVQPVVTPTIAVTASPAGTIAPGTQVTFTASFTNGGPTPDVLWRKNGTPIPFATGPTYTTADLRNGDVISARLTSYAPCANPTIVTSSGALVTMTTGITQVSSGGNWEGTITLYPNPNSGRFTIACDWGSGHRGERVKLEILNTLGQQVFADELLPNTAQWSLPVWLRDDVANGMYQLRLHTETMSTVRSLSIRR